MITTYIGVYLGIGFYSWLLIRSEALVSKKQNPKNARTTAGFSCMVSVVVLWPVLSLISLLSFLISVFIVADE